MDRTVLCNKCKNFNNHTALNIPVKTQTFDQNELYNLQFDYRIAF